MENSPSVLLLAVLSLAAPAVGQTAQEAFTQASTQDTAKGWEQFLAAHGDSKHAAEAKKHLDARLFVQASEVTAKDNPKADLAKVAKTIGKLYRRCRTPAGADKVFALWDHATWRWYSTTKSGAALRRYLLRFPGGKHHKEAKSAVAADAWEIARKTNTEAAYRLFLAKHSKSIYAARARAAIKRTAYSTAQSTDSIDGYLRFLRTNPGHKEAEKRLSFLMYQRAVDTDKLSYWQAFDNRYRRSNRRKRDAKLVEMLANARIEIERLMYEAIVAKPTLQLCRNYLSSYPKGPHRGQVQMQMEGCLFDDVMRKNTVKDYLVYLTKYPKGHRDNEVRQKLDALLFRKISGNFVNLFNFDKYLRLYPKEKAALSGRMEPFVRDWVKRTNTTAACRTYLKRYPTGEGHKEVSAIFEPRLWKEVSRKDWYTDYKDYLKLFPHGANAEAAAVRLQALQLNKPVIEMDYPKSVKKGANGKWSWKVTFKETGGKTGFKVTGYGWILKKNGARYGTKSYGYRSATRINHGSVKVKPGGTGSDTYWCRGDFVGGQAKFTWTGHSAGGHRLTFTQKVKLLAK